MKQLLYVPLFFLAFLLAPSASWAQTASCQPADCCQVRCGTKTKAAVTNATSTAPAPVMSGEASRLINFWVPAVGCDKKTANEQDRQVKDDNSRPSSPGSKEENTKMAVRKPEKC